MLCKYGCGHQGVLQFKNGSWCCSIAKESCPAFIKKRSDSRKKNGKRWSAEAKKNMSDIKTGVPVHTAKSKKILSDKSKKSWADRNYQITESQLEHISNLWKLRNTEPWNKGLTASEDPRIAEYANKQKGQQRQGNYKSNDFFKNNNPWQGKSRSGELSPRYNPVVHTRELKDYRNAVTKITEENYKKFKHIINPDNKTRAVAGINGGYQLDHIYPVSKGFENNIPPEIIGSIENLRIIEWKDNLLKSNIVQDEIVHKNILKHKQRK